MSALEQIDIPADGEYPAVNVSVQPGQGPFTIRRSRIDHEGITTCRTIVLSRDKVVVAQSTNTYPTPPPTMRGPQRSTL